MNHTCFSHAEDAAAMLFCGTGVARGFSGCKCTPRVRKKNWGNSWGKVVSAPPMARLHHLGGKESHFYWAEKGAAFYLRGIRVRRLTAKMVVSI